MALSTEWVALKTGQSGSGGVEYSHTLIEIQKNIQSKNEFKGQSTHFMIQDNAHVLEYRINYLGLTDTLVTC